MVATQLQTKALGDICSKDQLELLDSIDHLRLPGISQYISLPQIIVCGDQSSGKSSVLEAISGVSFPVKSNLCTRFPTELVLRRAPNVSSTVSIVPHETKNEEEKRELATFHEKLEGFDGLAGIIEAAKDAMGITVKGDTFSKDLLRIEITGPDRPHLTIVDLPGLIQSETKYQKASDVELIREVVKSYMREPRSIVLAVVSAKNDFANQGVMSLARSIDKTGTRTMGVITKPDTLTPGSASETEYVSLARNQHVEFRLGWHVLVNMDTETGKFTLAERDHNESLFFNTSVWQSLSPSLLGIGELRVKLSKVLLQQIVAELPSLVQEIETKLHYCQDHLAKLGSPRVTAEDQRRYLFTISQSFQSLAKSSIDGTYNDAFFQNAHSRRGYQQRIRAVVQNLNRDFAKGLSQRGHFRQIMETEAEPPIAVPKEVTLITRDAFISHVRKLIERTRGRELPGMFNPMIISDLFVEQSKPWEAIATNHVQQTWDAANEFISHVVAHVADAPTANVLLRDVVRPAMRDVLKKMTARVAELLKPHQISHPITYNHYFTETLQSIRDERRAQHIEDIVKRHLNIEAVDTVNSIITM